MQIGNQIFVASDWASLHREKMNEAEEVSFKETFERVRGGRMSERINETRKAPYSYLADDSGLINYNGVTFFCDYEKNQICLGDVSDKRNCISVALSGGGSLVVNRDNLGDLSKAIGMFSPEDINRIMRAIAQDTMCQQKLQELEEAENSIGGAEEDRSQEDAPEDTSDNPDRD